MTFTKEMIEQKAKELKPVGDWLLKQKNISLTQTLNGAFYDYSTVCELLNRYNSENAKEIEELKAEIERMKNLIEDAFFDGWNISISNERVKKPITYEKALKQFKDENNL